MTQEEGEKMYKRRQSDVYKRQVGEGIEKKEENFAEEVAKQLK